MNNICTVDVLNIIFLDILTDRIYIYIYFGVNTVAQYSHYAIKNNVSDLFREKNKPSTLRHNNNMI